MAKATQRRGKGRPFKPGQSGNPAGRKPGMAGFRERVQQALKGDGQEAIDLATSIMRGTAEGVALSKAGPIMVGPTIRERFQAAEWLCDRAFGKAPQDVNLGGQEGAGLVVQIVRKVVG